MITQRVFNKMRDRLAAASDDGPKAAFPWELLIPLIIKAVEALLEGCINPPANAAELKSRDIDEKSEDGPWVRHAVRSALSDAGVRPTRANVNAAMARLEKARAEATEEEAQELLDCCFSWET